MQDWTKTSRSGIRTASIALTVLCCCHGGLRSVLLHGARPRGAGRPLDLAGRARVAVRQPPLQRYPPRHPANLAHHAFGAIAGPGFRRRSGTHRRRAWSRIRAHRSRQELASLVGALGAWGQRWLPRQAVAEDLDLEPLLIDMQRRVRFEALPKDPLVVRFEIGQRQPRFMLLKAEEASLCTHNPGFPEPLTVRSPLAALVAWWRGDASFVAAQRHGAVDRRAAAAGARLSRLVRPLSVRRHRAGGVDTAVRNPYPNEQALRSIRVFGCFAQLPGERRDVVRSAAGSIRLCLCHLDLAGTRATSCCSPRAPISASRARCHNCSASPSASSCCCLAWVLVSAQRWLHSRHCTSR